MKTITATELHSAIQNQQNYLLLDVRQPEEVAICQIDNSRNIPMTEIINQQDQLNKDAAIVVICHHGMRSAQVAMFLGQNGFNDVTNLTGGIDAWATDVDTTMQRY